MFDWTLTARSPDQPADPDRVWDADHARVDYLHAFDRSGRRVTIDDMSPEQWQEFRSDFMRRLDRTIAFFYGNFVHGVRRVVVDGVEPTERDSDSFQFHLFDYVYHQILRKEHDWVARDLFRVGYRAAEETVRQHAYDSDSISGLLAWTCHEVMLDDLIERPVRSGDVLTNANTIILMGRTRTQNRIGRALYVAKHRGSACEETILPYTITESGIRFDD